MPADAPLDAKSLFGRALEIANPARRAAYLDEAAPTPDVRAEVAELLALHERAGGFLRRPAAIDHDRTAAHEPLTEGLGTRVGPYKLLQQIGEGGMGTVFMAEQEEPVRRKVALKIIKPGMDSKQVVARFEAERQALSMMDHPNIAKVLDAGTTASGRPYFVMELVHGVPITEFCDANKLNPQERLALFVPVCQAIQHAHMKGIIHRDVKPSNVLVTMYDDKPVPKVIDFGVAKAVEQRLTERTLFTQYGALVGTFEYMSPEQAEMNAFGVDTRSDVYSLGVLLYELLTGSTPLERQRLRTAALGEVVRLIKEEEAPRPSQRLSTSGTLAKVAAARKTDPGKLPALVRGELDWIVMRCLEKDRTRRYESATGLAKDVERYLSGDAVEACPPTFGYRLKKAYRRNRAAVLVTGAFALLVTGGAVLATVLAVQANRAERAATENAQGALHAQDRAAQQRDEAVRLGDELRRTSYQTSIGLAAAALESGQVELTRELLERTRPRPGEEDHRGFEWHYLNRALHGDAATLDTGGPVGTCAFAPDGKALAVAVGIEREKASAGGIQLWNAADRKLGHTIPLDGSRCAGLMFSADGSLLAGAVVPARDISEGARYEAEVRIWETGTGKPRGAYRVASGRIASLAFAPDGRRLAVTCRGSDPRPCGVVTLDSQTVREVSFTVLGKGWAGLDLAYTAAGRLLVAHYSPSGGQDGAVRLRDVDAGTETQVFDPRAAGTEAFDIVLSADGTHLLVVTLDQTVRVWQLTTDGPRLTCTIANVGMGTGAEFRFSADGRTCALINCYQSSVARVWDTRTGRLLLAARGHTDDVSTTALSPDGRTLATGSLDRTVKLWALPTPSTRPVSGRRQVVARPDGGFSALTFTERGAKDDLLGYSVRDVGTGQVLFEPPTRFSSRSPLPSARLSPNGARLAESEGRPNGRTRVWEVATRRAVPGMPADGVPGSPVAFLTADRLIVQPLEGGLHLWDLANPASGHRQLCPPGGKKVDEYVVHAPDPRFFATVSDRTVRVWDSRSLTEVSSVTLTGEFPGCRALSPDGGLLAVAEKNTVILLDARTGEVRTTLRGHSSVIRAAAFSPDGKRLFTGGMDLTVKVWDPGTGQELLTLRHTNTVVALAVSPNGHKLATQEQWDGRGRVFDATPLADVPKK